MQPKVPSLSPLVDWGVAAQTLPGQTESGDLGLVTPHSNAVLLAVVDGLGHGYEAAIAANLAVSTLKGHAHESVVSLVQLCHEALLGSRGVVMSLASLNANDGSMTWLGIGNVEGILLHADATTNPAREYLSMRGGVVGHRLPPLHPVIIPLMHGDTLVFATDGIGSGFTGDLPLNSTPEQLAQRILARYGKGTDDALALVVRYLGSGS